ncbi:MAG: hypothetical protein RL386_2134 [Bacteroidota bacterium]|jgi:hypothetical protein
MKRIFLFILFSLAGRMVFGQVHPAIRSWLQNTSQLGSYYVRGNPVAISNGILANCQLVRYSNDFVYVNTNGIPSYPTGPFNDGNPSQASSQNAIFRFPLNPKVETGTKTATTLGNIGLFVNGVAIFDYRDGVAWNTATNSFCGGPGNPTCPGGVAAVQSWNRDAIVYERLGFDCSKGHPAMGNYHHHQNPSAFDLDINVVSTICNLYDADGLYKIDPNKHSPLIGFAYDGFPIYGAYGYKNVDGTGGIVRMKSGYSLRNITVRTHHANGTDVPDGPSVSTTYPLGSFREDYAFVSRPSEPDYLDIHNGRFCVTPEYPNGTYAYFCTVDEKHNSAYPYVIGPTFYGVYANRKVTSVSESTVTYNPAVSTKDDFFEKLEVNVFPNPAVELIALQLGGLLEEDITVQLTDISGKAIETKTVYKGQTIAYFEVETLNSGTYIITLSNGRSTAAYRVMINR